KREKAGAKARAGQPEAKSLSSRQMVEALNAIEGLSDEDFLRGFVRALLTEEFGEKLANSAEFQAVVDRTAVALKEDPDLRARLNDVRKMG
ncbi:MAG: hypothetical protein AAFY81_12305, partial [Pseudomonadota bacterium]